MFEIYHALFQIGPLKAPGADGYLARFYQRHWGTLKTDVRRAIKEFFATGHMPEVVNETVIVLIPKKDNPELLSDFRPISLCNVLYKVVSKCLVNRLRPLLQDIISPTQSAFIPGRLITDNALIAFKGIHTITKSSDGKGKFCAYKLDLAKAYDRVDWSYSQKALEKLGFDPRWINWIMACVRSVSYKVRLNGIFFVELQTYEGIWQGDPFSPYLFLLVGEGLSKLIQHEIENPVLQELKICRTNPGISHLQFADDSLLFFKADNQQALMIKKVLMNYEKATGQLLNTEKCSILLGKNCDEKMGEDISKILNVTETGFKEKYLGLPVPEGRMKKGKFQPIKERYKKNMSDYTEKYRTGSAKEVHIKAVLQALATHTMSVFKLSTGLCEDLMQMIRNYWRGDDQDQRHIHWMS
jgi:hypothetical protein